jgi:hypothetical protein
MSTNCRRLLKTLPTIFFIIEDSPSKRGWHRASNDNIHLVAIHPLESHNTDLAGLEGAGEVACHRKGSTINRETLFVTPGPDRVGGSCATFGSDALQVLDQILLVCVAEVQLEVSIVVVHHVQQGGEAAIMEEPALLMRPQPRQRRRAVHVGRRAVGLERVDAELAGGMQIVPWFGEERRDVTGRALPWAVKDRLAPFEGGLVI